jgi:hypothetical protein
MIAISITQCVELHFSDELGCFFEGDYLGVVLRQVRAKNQRTFQNSPLGFEQSRHSYRSIGLCYCTLVKLRPIFRNVRTRRTHDDFASIPNR